MKIAAVSDLHGDFEAVYELIKKEKPNMLLCAGDWGTAEEISEQDFKPIIDKVPIITIFGNNDDLDLLARLRNQDGSPIFLETGKPKQIGKLSVAGINGIRAKSHKKAWYITDEEVIAAAKHLVDQNVDILLTHECPVGMADLAPTGQHAGKPSFTQAFKLIQPKIHLCGHLHRKSSYATKDGKFVVNIGITKEGDYVLIHPENGGLQFESKTI